MLTVITVRSREKRKEKELEFPITIIRELEFPITTITPITTTIREEAGGIVREREFKFYI